ncbi:MAG: hypothetical protein PHU23_01140 [Dehalococcoidales bacterium]|nr:hypothetical protein [Dehalococcoidales bacterium]
MTNTDYIIVILAAFLGSLGSGFFGWVKSKEQFVLRKFMASVWSAVLSGMIFALAYEKTSEISVFNFVTAFLGGAGVDVLTNRAQLNTGLNSGEVKTIEEVLRDAVKERTENE